MLAVFAVGIVAGLLRSVFVVLVFFVVIVERVKFVPF
jgi:hypothetical protein